MRRLQYFHLVTYAISMLFLIPALFIFVIYKQLQVYRITMHKHLFTALLLNALTCIIFKSFIILEQLDLPSDRGDTVLEENGIGCKVLCVITKYTRMTTYMWMFCEGFYLHEVEETVIRRVTMFMRTSATFTLPQNAGVKMLALFHTRAGRFVTARHDLNKQSETQRRRRTVRSG
ncbi:calcitonin gene-related peptide type 1 receptor [Nephila pilipes]|uniref:Calcitonin gene-related peptide type 1 receptor n=1 Tax=Nephila pilipes TaxID=299642 RepID=A0A8X6PKJ8_NEPPI|nr:calcitonin gene-related peptide type 1 receptor [Nephila pilipes]